MSTSGVTSMPEVRRNLAMLDWLPDAVGRK
jgi:hypothetical protein